MLLADRPLGVDVMKLKLNSLRWVVSPDRSGPSNATRSPRFRVDPVKCSRASRRPRRRAAEAGGRMLKGRHIIPQGRISFAGGDLDVERCVGETLLGYTQACR